MGTSDDLTMSTNEILVALDGRQSSERSVPVTVTFKNKLDCGIRLLMFVDEAHTIVEAQKYLGDIKRSFVRSVRRARHRDRYRYHRSGQTHTSKDFVAFLNKINRAVLASAPYRDRSTGTNRRRVLNKLANYFTAITQT